MKLRYEMLITEVDGVPVAVPVDSGKEFCGLIHMNGTAQDILEILREDVTEEEIIEKLLEMYNASKEQLEDAVKKVIDELRTHKLIVE